MGVGYQGFSAAEKDTDENPALKNIKLNSFFTQVGFGIDYKYNMNGALYATSSHRISLKYAYRIPHYGRSYAGMDGFTHSITVSWGFGGRAMKRVK